MALEISGSILDREEEKSYNLIPVSFGFIISYKGKTTAYYVLKAYSAELVEISLFGRHKY